MHTDWWICYMPSSNILAFVLEGSHLDVEHDVVINLLVSNRNIVPTLQDIKSQSCVLHLQFEGIMPESGPHMVIYF